MDDEVKNETLTSSAVPIYWFLPDKIVFDPRDGELTAEEGLGGQVFVGHDPVHHDAKRPGGLVQGHRSLAVVQLTEKQEQKKEKSQCFLAN